MRGRVLITLALATCAVAGCSRQQTLSCEAAGRYTAAVSAPPVQIPDDLSPPSETEALRLPPDAATNPKAPSEPCLESPPSFFAQGRPGRARTQPADEPQPATEEAPAASDAGGDRVIDN